MNEELIKILQDNMVPGAIGISIIPFIYKAFRIFKEDRKVDKMDEEEKEFRAMLRDEAKESKAYLQKLLVEKAELSAEIARLQIQNAHLIEQVTQLLSSRHPPQ